LKISDSETDFDCLISNVYAKNYLKSDSACSNYSYKDVKTFFEAL